MTMRSSTSLLLVLMAAVGPACAPTVEPPTPTVAEFPSDGEILSIALALHEAVIATNREASSRARQEPVREFTIRIVDEHGAAAEQLRALEIEPVEHPLTARIEHRTAETAAVLGQYRRMAYDRALLDSQNWMHRYALNVMDKLLIPAAHDERMRSLLEHQREILAAHLEQALQIRAEIEMR